MGPGKISQTKVISSYSTGQKMRTGPKQMGESYMTRSIEHEVLGSKRVSSSSLTKCHPQNIEISTCSIWGKRN